MSVRPRGWRHTVRIVPPAEKSTNRPCEECGGVVIAGREPITVDSDPELAATGATTVGSEWCTNLDCPSNHAVPGLARIGVNDYTCKVCGMNLTTPTRDVLAHRRTH